MHRGKRLVCCGYRAKKNLDKRSLQRLVARWRAVPFWETGGIPPPPRSIGIIGLGENGAQNLGDQQLAGKILCLKDLSLTCWLLILPAPSHPLMDRFRVRGKVRCHVPGLLTICSVSTYHRAARKCVLIMKTNITLKLDANLLREIRILAAEEDTSISAMLAARLEEIVRERKAYHRARGRALARLREGMDLRWTPGSRDEIHER